MKLLVLPGDGIGPEITQATIAVLEAADRRFKMNLSFETREIGFAALEKYGTTCPDAVLARARELDGIILGPISHLDYPARDKGGVNVSAALRVKLDLYANVRPARTRPGIGRTARPMDLVIMRECTEGFYPDRNMHAGSGEFMPTPDIALSLRKITAQACERIARRAFELSRTRRRLVTAVHKANNFILTDGLFLKVTREVAAQFPDVKLEEEIVDAMAAKLVRMPEHFDVVLAMRTADLGGKLGTRAFGAAVAAAVAAATS